MIVDAHVHLLPERLAAKIRRFFEIHEAPKLIYPYAPDSARAALQAAGVERCWSLPYAHRAGVAAGLNRWMSETWRDDSFVVPGATVHPDDPVEALVREADRELGLRVFKIHCSVGAFPADDARLDPLWLHASEKGRPVVVHCGSAADGTATENEVAAVERTANRFPEARIIVAHFGAPAVGRVAELIRRTRRVYADLTPMVATPVHPSRERIAGIERRILFGSDTPTVGLSIEDLIAAVRSWGLDPEDETAILGGTAQGLLDSMV